MTTIAWDGKVLAADRLSSATAYAALVHKIHRGPTGMLVGACGNSDACHLMCQWVLSGEIGEPPVALKSDDWSSILIVEPNGDLFVMGEYGRYPILDRQFAIGTGRCYALAAMACGKSAPDAVKLAMKFDPYTGLGVDVLPLRGTK